MIYETIKRLSKEKGLSINQLEKTLGLSKGSLCRIDTNRPSIDRLQRIADFFEVSLDYLTTGKNEPEKKEATLTPKDARDIEKILEQTKEQLLTQEGLMFDGDFATPEAIDSIISAMQIGMEMAKKKNKEKYTPKKYKKD